MSAHPTTAGGQALPAGAHLSPLLHSPGDLASSDLESLTPATTASAKTSVPSSNSRASGGGSGKDPKILLCEYCDASFTSSSGLYYHKASMHLQKKFVCTVCGKVLRRKENLNHHLRTHNNPTSTECPYCHVYFGAKHISNHIVENHREEMMKGTL